MLIQEEMRRTVVYLEWKATWWKRQVNRRLVDDPLLAQGLSAYAHRQADMLSMLATNFIQKWVPLLNKSGADTSWAGQYQLPRDRGEHIDEKSDKEISEGEEEKDETEDEEDIFDSYDLDD